MIRLDVATEADARELAPRMRAADAAELLASTGHQPLEGLLESLELSSEAYALFFDGELAALCGLAPGPFFTFVGYPWLLGSDVIERHKRAFVRASRAALEEWASRYFLLEQAVDARYVRALRWAARVGFQVEPPAPFGVLGLPFCRITLRRSHV